MIRPYEVVYIFDSALEDEAIAQKLTTVHAMIQVEGAEPPVLNIWGRRTLAYPIKRHTTGYYVVANFNTDATLLPEFERALKLDDASQRAHLCRPARGDEPLLHRIRRVTLHRQEFHVIHVRITIQPHRLRFLSRLIALHQRLLRLALRRRRLRLRERVRNRVPK